MSKWNVHYFLLDGQGAGYQTFDTKEDALEFYNKCKPSVCMKDVELKELL